MKKEKEERIRVFPKQLDNSFRGNRIAVIVFALITVFTLARSCIHIFAPDGGASSIAGINTSVEGGSNVISMFALWGLAQLLMGLVYVVVFFRYKSLIPFMYILMIIEYSGRVLIGMVKPLIVSHTPPGAIGDYILIPLAIVMLILCLKRSRKE
jgi:uncharacterized membrane protein